MNLDRKAIVAVALCVLVLILWRPLLRSLGLAPYVDRPRPAQVTAVDTTRRELAPGTPSGTAPKPAPRAAREEPAAPQISGLPLVPVVPVLERSIQIETPLYRATFTNRGARLLSVELKPYASAYGVSRVAGTHQRLRRGETVPPGDRVALAGGPLFALDLGSGAALQSLGDATYAVSESLDAAGAPRAVTFTLEDTSGLRVRQTFRARPDDYALDLEVDLRGIPAAWRTLDYSLSARSWPLLTDADLTADMRALRATSLVGTNIHREHAGNLLKGPRTFDGNAAWAAVQTRYFVAGVAIAQATGRGVISSAERRPLTPQELAILPPGTRAEQEVAINSLVIDLPAQGSPAHRFVLYAGPSEYFRLAALGLRLERAVDLGWNWVLPFSKLLLQLLNWLFAVLRNYGLAIVALATLVRVLLHPLSMMSMKSMRAMQKLQPEMERIKEKYKGDAQALNTAVMALYKDHKVNPAGGCLPMLVQMPLFLALYQVLFNAIELRQAPFVAWMNDLSAPDLLFRLGPFPVRLLPLLMAGSGLLSQKVTPTDPRQLPTMYMMNVVMLVFFYNLPSGLVLYWTVMNLLTALQQWMVLRQDGHVRAAVPEVASAPPARPKRRREAAR